MKIITFIFLVFVFGNSFMVFSQDYYKDIYAEKTGQNIDMDWLKKKSIKSVKEYRKEKDTLLLMKQINVDKDGKITNIKQWDINAVLYIDTSIYYDKSKRINKIIRKENNNFETIKKFSYQDNRLIKEEEKRLKNNKVKFTKVILRKFNKQGLLIKEYIFSSMDSTEIDYKYNDKNLLIEKFFKRKDKLPWTSESLSFEIKDFKSRLIDKDKLLSLKDTGIYVKDTLYNFSVDTKNNKILQEKIFRNNKIWKNNSYSERYAYDNDGNLIRKTLFFEDRESVTQYEYFNHKLSNVISENFVAVYKYKGDKKIEDIYKWGKHKYRYVYKNELLIRVKNYIKESTGCIHEPKFTKKYRYFKNKKLKSVKKYNSLGLVTHSIKLKYDKNDLLHKIRYYEFISGFGIPDILISKWFYKYTFYE